jgi:hypothetical protein
MATTPAERTSQMQLTLTNKFHGTETTIRPKILDNGNLKISYRTYKRAHKALCGHSDCCCGGFNFGENGLELVSHYDGWVCGSPNATVEFYQLED